MADLDGYGLEPRNFQLVTCRWNNNCTAPFVIVDEPIKKTHYLDKYMNVEHAIKYSYVLTKVWPMYWVKNRYLQA
jgi:hypothetical protein